MNSQVFPSIYAISTKIGTLVNVEEINDVANPNMVSDLKERGINTFSKIIDPLSRILVESILNTLGQADLKYTNIDGVMIVTESYSELIEQPIKSDAIPFRVGRNLIFEILAEIGLDQARVFSSTYGGSGNFLNAIFLADSIIQTGKVKNLLMICFDRLPQIASRFMSDAIALIGDGVSTFIYGHTHNNFIPLHKVNYVNITPFMKVERFNSMGEKMLEMYRSTKSAAADCFDYTGNQPSNYDWLILNNYNFPTNRIFCSLLGFSLEKTWMHNAARIGHIASCDSIINLSDIMKSGNIKSGGKSLIFVNGPIFCGTISLTTLFPY